MLVTVLKFFILLLFKLLAILLYRFNIHWLSPKNDEDWKQVNLIIFLNHTSLFETLFLRLLPNKVLWRLAKDLLIPSADSTLKRPIIGKLLRFIVPGCIPISRKNDHTWQNFLDHIEDKKITAIMPEGRMKRRNGLDKEGNPMSIRGGIVDVMQRLEHGKILFVYSGGLHHIQAPGEKLPKVFKTIKANIEVVDLVSYKEEFSSIDSDKFRKLVINDLSQRLINKLPPDFNKT